MSNYSEIDQINNLVRVTNYLCSRIDNISNGSCNSSSCIGGDCPIDDYTLICDSSTNETKFWIGGSDD